MKKFLVSSMKVVGGIAIVYLLISLLLVYWPSPEPFEGTEPFPAPWETDATDRDPVDAEELRIPMRDGEVLFARRFPADAGTTIILSHGVAADSSLMQQGAAMMNELTGAAVITPDLRGHGKSGGRPFDIDYIGQYEDDLEDTIRFVEQERPDDRIIVAGHSMGGGVAMRYALKEGAPVPDAYLLFAPNFGEGPTQRTGEDQEDASAFVHFDFRRMIGLLMLNSVAIHALDDLPILYFNRAPETLEYSYRAVMSAQPVRPQTSDVALQAVTSPLLVIVGANDEVFLVDQFEAFVSANSDGETVVLPGLTHDGVMLDPATFDVVAEWYRTLP